jgi:uncharacterized HAD superfamily protein
MKSQSPTAGNEERKQYDSYDAYSKYNNSIPFLEEHNGRLKLNSSVETLVNSVIESNKAVLRSNEIIEKLVTHIVSDNQRKKHEYRFKRQEPLENDSYRPEYVPQVSPKERTEPIAEPMKPNQHLERWASLETKLAELQNSLQGMLSSKHKQDVKKVIAVDVDEVLAPFMEKLVIYYNLKFPEKKIAFEHYTTYHVWEVWGMPPQEGVKLVDEFFESDLFKEHIPIVGSRDVLRRLAKDYELVVVTSRHATLEGVTQKFLDTCYPGLFSRALFGNHFGAGKKVSKPDMCQQVKAVLLIDDQFDYARQCAERGMKSILFGDYPWNAKVQLHDNMKRVNNWFEVEEAIERLLEGTD